jgi:hypothetical protein
MVNQAWINELDKLCCKFENALRKVDETRKKIAAGVIPADEADAILHKDIDELRKCCPEIKRSGERAVSFLEELKDPALSTEDRASREHYRKNVAVLLEKAKPECLPVEDPPPDDKNAVRTMFR